MEALGLATEEVEELDREQKRLANLGLLQSTAGRLLDRLYDGESAIQIVSAADAEVDAIPGRAEIR